MCSFFTHLAALGFASCCIALRCMVHFNLISFPSFFSFLFLTFTFYRIFLCPNQINRYFCVVILLIEGLFAGTRGLMWVFSPDSGRLSYRNITKRYAHLAHRNVRNFETQQEDMMASMRKRGIRLIFCVGFSHDLYEKKWIQFHASCIIKGLLWDWEAVNC